jgi:hypothetical protein
MTRGVVARKVSDARVQISGEGHSADTKLLYPAASEPRETNGAVPLAGAMRRQR